MEKFAGTVLNHDESWIAAASVSQQERESINSWQTQNCYFTVYKILLGTIGFLQYSTILGTSDPDSRRFSRGTLPRPCGAVSRPAPDAGVNTLSMGLVRDILDFSDWNNLPPSRTETVCVESTMVYMLR